mgnify:CR=1 FL=1
MGGNSHELDFEAHAVENAMRLKQAGLAVVELQKVIPNVTLVRLSDRRENGEELKSMVIRSSAVISLPRGFGPRFDLLLWQTRTWGFEAWESRSDLPLMSMAWDQEVQTSFSVHR